MENVVGALNGVPGNVDDYSERTTSRLVDVYHLRGNDDGQGCGYLVSVISFLMYLLHVLDHVRFTRAL